MVKYFALATIVLSSLVVVETAEARGRRGCATCNAGYVASCPGGFCTAPPAAPMKTATTIVVPSAPVAVAPAAPAPVVSTPVPMPRSYVTSRRGVFVWRQ